MSKPQDDLERLQQQQTRLNRIILGALLLILLVSLGIFLASRSETPHSPPASGEKTVYLSLATAPLGSPGTAPAASTPALTSAVASARSSTASTASTAVSATPTTAATHSAATGPAAPIRQTTPVSAPPPGAQNATTAAPRVAPATVKKAAVPPAPEPRKPIASATHSPAATSAAARSTSMLPCKTAGWYVQLGAFGRASATQPIVTELQKKGFSACVATLPQNRLYRVLVGPLPSRFAASNVTARIAQLTGRQGYPQHWPGTQ
ncbi:MAG: SPOR domain-containing protein [Acidithiobacillus sp.]